MININIYNNHKQIGQIVPIIIDELLNMYVQSKHKIMIIQSYLNIFFIFSREKKHRPACNCKRNECRFNDIPHTMVINLLFIIYQCNKECNYGVICQL